MDGPVLGLQLDQVAADVLHRLGQLIVGGNPPGTAGKPPHLPQGAGRDVERTLGLGVQLEGQLQQLEQPRLNVLRPLGTRAIQPADLAGRAKDRHLLFQGLNQIERLERGPRAALILARVEKDLELDMSLFIFMPHRTILPHSRRL